MEKVSREKEAEKAMKKSRRAMRKGDEVEARYWVRVAKSYKSI